MLLISVLIISCKNKDERLIFFNKEDQTVFAIENNKMQIFYNSFHYPIHFSRQPNSLFCGESNVFGCYDLNRKSYDVCIGFNQLSSELYKLTNGDSCVNNISYLSKAFQKLDLRENEITWDSIIIHYKDNIEKKYIIPFQDASFKAANHPFTIKQEVSLMINERFSLATSLATNENQIDVSVFQGKEIIFKMDGNLVLPIFKSTFTFINPSN